jgi:hypothetical protein
MPGIVSQALYNSILLLTNSCKALLVVTASCGPRNRLGADVTVCFGSVLACRGQGWIFNLATCYARPNGWVRPKADNTHTSRQYLSSSINAR